VRLSPCLCLLTFFVINAAAPVCAAENGKSACPAIVVDIGSGSAKDRTLVCDGVAKARTFFLAHGIEVQRRIRVRLHGTAIGERANHIGLYDARSDQVELLTFGQARHQTAKDSLFGMQTNEALYVSVVVHEIAHAIAHQNFEVRPASLVAQEYIAYVAQLSTMEEPMRSKILHTYDLDAFGSIDEMSSTYYGLNPSGFGIKAFRHYQALPERSRFISGLLSGAIRPAGFETEGW